jgi:hypothetical protein
MEAMLNIFICIMKDRVLDQFCVDSRVTEEAYLRKLKEEAFSSVLNTTGHFHTYSVQDGAPAQCSISVRG